MSFQLDGVRFERWLDYLSRMPDSAVAENLYRLDTPEGVLRRANLEEYFRRVFARGPRVVIVGEAPGYQGTRRTGVPFASEYHLSGESEIDFFRDTTGFTRVYNGARLSKEPTSTIMWRTINHYEQLPLLWAVSPLHPHQSGSLESNRTPTPSEARAGREQLVELLNIVHIETVVALGNVAKTTLDSIGVSAQKVRHPSRGGATLFAEQLDTIMV